MNLKAFLTLFNAVPSNPSPPNKGCYHSEYNLFITPEATHFQEEILDWAKSEGKVSEWGMNQALHKSWDKVMNSAEELLRFEQLLHYFSTYGMESFGLTPLNWVPDEELECPGDQAKVWVVGGLPTEVLVQKSINILNGPALKSQTVIDLIEGLQDLGVNLNLLKVTNREARMVIMEKTGVFPEDGADLFKFLVYLATRKTQTVNNKELWVAVAQSGFILPELSSKQEIALASSFNRFKKIWLLGFKKSHHDNRAKVNFISKLSKTFHKPLTQTVINAITALDRTVKPEEIRTASFQQLVRAYNALALYTETPERFYRIRNGKSWATTSTSNKDKDILEGSKKVILEEIRRRVPNKTISIPSGFSYPVPTSHKAFCGAFPFGTRISLPEGRVLLGLAWSMKDLDLSAVGEDGEKIGWDAHWLQEGKAIAYSGDVTGGEYCAEWLSFNPKSLTQAYTLFVNLYSDGFTHPRIIVASSHDELETPRNYLVAQKDVIAEFPLELHGSQKEFIIGVVSDSNLYLYNMGRGKSRVSRTGGSCQNIVAGAKTMLRLEDIFTCKEESGINLTPEMLLSFLPE